LLRETVTVQVRRHIREGDLAPRQWPPNKDGTWLPREDTTGPPDTLQTEQDLAEEFK
jgi:hypothetical protein